MSTTKSESTFRLQFDVEISIAATPEQVWARLTDAVAFPTWNRTVTSIEGRIAKGERLAIKVPLAPGRTFKPRVTVFEAPLRMVWSDGMAPMFKGVRTFRLMRHPDGTTSFAMSESFKGVMLPLIKRALPDFRDAFTTYAADLKRACES